MFTNNLLLRHDQHADLRLGETRDWGFASKEMFVPVVYSEMADVAREYPLLFIKDRDLLFALTGLEKDINAYVADDGRWLATYIPGRLQAYPLALTQVPDKPGEFALLVDSDAPQLMDKNGQLLFVNGEPSPLLKQRMALLEKMQKAEIITLQMVKILRESGLLIDRGITIRQVNEEPKQITGLQVIDENKLNAMPHDEFAALRDKGVLPLIYAHLLSMANLRQGALAGKYPELAQKKDASDFSLEDMLSSDTISFN
jgi:hypothetical protein